MITPDENNALFQLAANFVNQTSEHIFLTGKAGTGKTTFLRYIKEHTHKRALVAAPTGVAAINAGGVTLHSLFQLPFEPYIPGVSIASIKKNYFRFTKQKLDLLRQLELLIIDEVSMLRADTLDSIDASLRWIRRSPKPFGGVQMLYIGDVFQLPPVTKDDEWQLLKPYYTSMFFFHSQAIGQTQPVYLELKKVYRQGDPFFVDLLNRVRNNDLQQADIQLLNERYNPGFVPSDEDKFITLTTHNYKADQINNRKLAALSAPEHVFKGEIAGEFPDYSLPTDMQLQLKEGAQIMFLKNDTEDPRRYFNGKIATVSRILDNKICVYLSDLDLEIQLQKETWRNVRYSLNKDDGTLVEDELGTFTQYPIRLAWAITIHKSQGLTFEKAIVDIGSSFAPGQAYVALSRCTSLDGIVLYSRIHPDCVMTDQFAFRFSKSEKDLKELDRIFEYGKRKFWAERLLFYFNWGRMYGILKEMEKQLEEKDGDEYLLLKRWSDTAKTVTREFEGISIKFQFQLEELIKQENVNDDIALLTERCRKAVAYFHENVIKKVLLPLQHCIVSFKSPKKAKTFYKNMVAIEEDIILFLKDMQRVRYNDVPLAEDMEFTYPKREDLFGEPDSEEEKPQRGKRKPRKSYSNSQFD